ncbi:hypothetical protein U1Q18_050613 [Sarracenia purpurea var. burkii]
MVHPHSAPQCLNRRLHWRHLQPLCGASVVNDHGRTKRRLPSDLHVSSTMPQKSKLRTTDWCTRRHRSNLPHKHSATVAIPNMPLCCLFDLLVANGPWLLSFYAYGIGMVAVNANATVIAIATVITANANATTISIDWATNSYCYQMPQIDMVLLRPSAMEAIRVFGNGAAATVKVVLGC